MTDFLSEKRKEITSRLNELKPLVDEYHRLEAAATALAGVNGARSSARVSAPSAASNPRRGRPPGSKNRPKAVASVAAAPKASSRRGGRPKGSGSRSVQTLGLVEEQPGITIRELADKMGIKQTYLYRVLPPLQKEGKVRKRGRGWHAVA
jgi:hypothetical protein